MGRSSIIFDCERMKYPHTGLFFFCDMLASSLIKEQNKHDKDLVIYTRPSLHGRWGDHVKYKDVHSFHKLFLYPRNTKVWHSTFQLTPYIPKGVKVVLTVHDLNFLYEKNKFEQKRYLHKLQKIVNKVDYLVAISENAKKDLINHIDIKKKPVEVIYNGCNIYTGEIKEPQNKPNHPFLFTIGAVLPKKNFHVLPRLLKDNNYELIIAGINHEIANKIYIHKILEEAEKAGVKDRVKIIGTIPQEEKYWYLQNCKAFMFPSIAEGFGLPVIEAMYYKKPIFLSRHTCLPEIGGEYAYYFNYEFNEKLMIEEFNEGMANFENEGKDKEKMKEYALSFSWDIAAQRYWKIYDKLSK